MHNPSPILSQKYPATEHIHRVLSQLTSTCSPLLPTSDLTTSIIYLSGTKSAAYTNSDLEVPFRQSRNFYYVTGCNEPDCAYSYNAAIGKSTLFIPAPPDQRTMVYNGPAMTVEEAKERYDVDEVEAVEAGLDVLAMLIQRTTHALDGTHNQSILTLDHLLINGIKQPTTSPLLTAFHTARISKTPHELAALREANRISSHAHTALMRHAKHATNERELKAVFVSSCIAHGGDEQAYGPIVAAGTRGATLHYMADNQPIERKGNVLVDAACEFACYAADVTRTIPAGGKFDRESREIYEVVLDMQKAVLDMLKEGVNWDDCGDRAHEVLVDGLLRLGVLRGGKGAIKESKVSYLFMMHGLGHYIGLETHDVGGPVRSSTQSAMQLAPKQLRRTPIPAASSLSPPAPTTLPADAVITVEPGIYFNHLLLDPALKQERFSRFIDADVLDRYWKVGGVRIEDCVVITKDGYENLTTVVKEVEDVEALVSGGLDGHGQTGTELCVEEKEEEEWVIVD